MSPNILRRYRGASRSSFPPHDLRALAPDLPPAGTAPGPRKPWERDNEERPRPSATSLPAPAPWRFRRAALPDKRVVLGHYPTGQVNEVKTVVYA
jgi:hypothetical protein